MFPGSFLPFFLALPSWFNEKLRLRHILRKKIGYRKNVLYIPHHLSHAASAFYVSPFEEAAVLTLDGAGEWQTSTLGIGRGQQLQQLAEINFPHSLGLLYSAVTAYLGFKVNNDEYKVMGLAGYGKPRYLEKLRKHTPFKEIYIQPEAGDGGGCLGAAFYAYHAVFDQPRSFVMEHAYWGPQYTRAEMKQFLDDSGIKYKEYADENSLLAGVAKLIKDSFVIGWLQGRMEWGPRALGARSILSNPTNPKMQEILNVKVKHREPFRPFAPAVTAEKANEYFQGDEVVPMPADFMLMVYPVRPDHRDKIPAVTHVDGTGRLQTVRRKQNPRYYDMIKAFGELSGYPILINTSFNIRGEPIVCTPRYPYLFIILTRINYFLI